MIREDFYRTLRSPWLWTILALSAVLPFMLSSYHVHILTIALVYVALASAWNIVGGMGGQISLAHSLFIGTGAMLSAALLVKFGVNMWAGLVIAAATAGMLGAIIAWIDFRFQLGHLSFVLITLAFAEMAAIVVEGWDFLGGASGLLLPRDTGDVLAFQFGGGRGAFWVMLGLAALTVLVNVAILNTPLGYYLRTIRDNEKAAQAIGVNVLRHKTIAMIISAVLTSIVGTAYVRYLTFADPYLLASPVITIEIVLFATVGGLGRAYGPALGALLLVPLGEVLRGKLGGVVPGLHYFIYGIVVIVVILATPSGLLPLFERLLTRCIPKLTKT
ncbi:amino acid/amide ABC transporter membrane protein 2 (HAAT family) [Bradyrhizobium sp. R2.2-H]|uniref:branched-chain amino acid ABC transporter permease n=1 Tax=unclassified Bradyrhizobium TaxID=2631580 RepID=UPI0010503CFA|nr:MULTISPECIES: branched-chain amino acid ABC transporter permease [unclassified Bradyrhizobium]TCU64072.1 amino acid/amide ABC transporter membrane protein 2 (HAAT family) [Bradyrhizobium sp. Y-H1]TCU65838.1 amino acid/amide ABC transporter membrane protein 2 (HAAT family) [Bradyrhizobium sp. R2.2-H]